MRVGLSVLTRASRSSSGADVTLFPAGSGLSPPAPEGSQEARKAADETRKQWLANFVPFNLNITHAFYTHPKVLVVGLNGPVIGLSAALVAFADFIYCTPSAFLLTPFSSLGLVAEGGASHALVQRLGVSKANEALITSRRIPADELLTTGFVNKIFHECPGGRPGDDAYFRDLVLREIDERMGDHLVGDSMIGIKALIRRPQMDVLDRQNVAEVFAGLDRFTSGVPQQEFLKIATGQKRHKL